MKKKAKFTFIMIHGITISIRLVLCKLGHVIHPMSDSCESTIAADAEIVQDIIVFVKQMY